MAAILRFDVGNASELPVFNLRDGDISEVKSMIVRPTIPAMYHWRSVGGILPEVAKGYMDLYIKTAFVQINSSAPADWNLAKRKKAGIMLGVVRCVSTFLYKLTAQDFIPGETAEAYYLLPAVTAAAPNPVLTTAADLPEVTANALAAEFALNDEDRNAISVISSFAAGVLPLQGYSLIQCQHHYISDAKSQSFKAYQTVERQFWKSSAVAPWFDADLEMARDICWHKACHPVSMSFKMNLAGSLRIKASLEKMQIGSASVRLPAYEPVIRACTTWVTVLSTVRNYFLAYGGKLDYYGLVFALDFVAQFPPDVAVDVVDVIYEKKDPDSNTIWEAPKSIDTRTKAIDWLTAIMQNNTPLVATAYGFYVAVSENTQAMSGEAITDSLKGAFSLSKLKTQSLASYMLGYEAYKDYAAFKAKQRTESKFTALTLNLMI